MKKAGWVLIGLTALFLMAAPVFADCQMHGKDCAGKQCSLKGGSDCGKGGDCDAPCPIASKLLKKAHFYLENQTELGLSEDQVKQIKAIKAQNKKAAIKAKADMEIAQMDMMEKLSETKVDVEALNAMVDQASSGMAAGAKATIADYAKLKAVLNEQQHAKAKELWKKKN